MVNLHKMKKEDLVREIRELQRRIIPPEESSLRKE